MQDKIICTLSTVDKLNKTKILPIPQLQPPSQKIKCLLNVNAIHVDI